MNLENNSANKSKVHTVYKNKDGARVPGVTTITGILDKPALKIWANKLGLQGIEIDKYVDDLAEIGTLAHYLIACHITNTKPITDDYSKNQIDRAENSFIKFLTWFDQQEFELIGSEMPLISEIHQFGGMIDIYGKLNRKKTLLDIKTSKAVYSEMFTQVAGGYEILLVENGYEVEDVRIIRVGRDETEGFEDTQVIQRDLHKKLFLLCREIYEVKKLIK